MNDPESGPEPFTEAGRTLNPTLRGQDIRDVFTTADHHILLVANKFQTGFDQPLLCGMYVDRRLAGIQAVQTLSRLNRAHPGKDTTYILDFVNSEAEVLDAFRAYHTTAELAGVTDPNLIYDLRAKLDTTGFYDDFEVDRVVAVEMNSKATQGDLVAALEPVADRLMRRYKAAQEKRASATERDDSRGVEEAQDERKALTLFKRDMERAIFFKRLSPLLEFGREREGVDLSRLKLTHHTVKSQGVRNLPLGDGEKELLKPLTETGTGAVNEKEKLLLSEIISRVNDLFEGDLTDDDQLIYVNNVLKGKLLESETLGEQAANNSKEQFAASPDLARRLERRAGTANRGVPFLREQ